MIGLIFAAALANSITAPVGIWARAQWGATRPNVRLQVENRSDVTAWLVDVTCDGYDAHGVLVGVSTGNLAELKPHERVETWATSEAKAPAVRFKCRVAVNEWRRPN